MCDMCDRAGDDWLPCDGTDEGATCGHFEPMPDVAALRELADEIDRSALELLKTNDLDPNRKRRSMRMEHAKDLMAASGRIRELCGEPEAKPGRIVDVRP